MKFDDETPLGDHDHLKLDSEALLKACQVGHFHLIPLKVQILRFSRYTHNKILYLYFYLLKLPSLSPFEVSKVLQNSFVQVVFNTTFTINAGVSSILGRGCSIQHIDCAAEGWILLCHIPGVYHFSLFYGS